VTQEAFHGAATRTPVIHGGRQVKGLHQRTLADGTVVYEARLRIDGKDTRVVLEATTRSDAVREYQGLRTDRDRGDIQENRLLNPTVGDVCEEFVERLTTRVGIRDERLRITRRTLETYTSLLELHIRPELGRKRIAEVEILDIRRLLDSLAAKGLSPSMSTATLSLTGRLFSFAVKQGYLAHNIVRELDREDRPGQKRLTEPRYLTQEEIGRLLDTAPVYLRALLACCAYAGLRSGEARALRWGDIDLDEGVITICGQLNQYGEFAPTKTPGSSATVPVLPALHRELRAHRSWVATRDVTLLHRDRYVFAKTPRHGVKASMVGDPYTSHSVIDAIRKAGTKAGLNPSGLPTVTLHDLRHSFIALALEHGATLPEAAELARHSTPQTTLRVYAGLTKDGRGRAARKLLDAGFGV
jgi:integrase